MIAVLPGSVMALAVLLFFAVDFAARKDWIGLPSGFYVASTTIGWMVNIVALLSIIMTCFHVSGEFALGTVKPAWVRPVSRSSWYSGKLISSAAASTFIFMLAVVTVTILAWAKYGFSDLMEKNYLVHSASSMAGRFVLVTLLTVVTLWALVAVTAMLASFFNRPGSAIAVAILLSFLMTVIAIFPRATPFLLSTCLTSPFEQMTFMSKGLPLPLEWTTLIWRELACSFAWITAAVIAGITVIRKKEITF